MILNYNNAIPNRFAIGTTKLAKSTVNLNTPPLQGSIAWSPTAILAVLFTLETNGTLA